MAKDENIIIRVSQEEKASFLRAADLSGNTLSVWIRQNLRKICAKELNAANERPKF